MPPKTQQKGDQEKQKQEEHLKIKKDALISSLFGLSKAATESSNATLEFFNAISGAESDAVSNMMSTLNADLERVASALSTTKDKPADERAENGKRKRSAKKPKDPNAPKRPSSSYFAYLTEARKLIPQEREEQGLPSLNSAEMAKEVANRWHSLTAEEQKPWRDLYLREKEQYDRLKDRYDRGENIADEEAVNHTQGPASDDKNQNSESESDEESEDDEAEELKKSPKTQKASTTSASPSTVSKSNKKTVKKDGASAAVKAANSPSKEPKSHQASPEKSDKKEKKKDRKKKRKSEA